MKRGTKKDDMDPMPMNGQKDTNPLNRVLGDDVNKLYQRLDGSPLKLFTVCWTQMLLLLGGSIFMHQYMDVGEFKCDLAFDGMDASIECANCQRVTVMTMKRILILTVGTAVILMGLVAALKQDKDLCRYYGVIMMIYAGFLGFTTAIIAWSIPGFVSAAESIEDDTQDIINSMWGQMFLYAANCLLDGAGAWYAIQSKQYFDYKAIKDRNDQDEAWAANKL